MKTVKFELAKAQLIGVGEVDAIRMNGKLYGFYSSKSEAEKALTGKIKEYKESGYQVN